MKNINISVIIPVYNSEKFLFECIDSVVKQSGLLLEIILVNDGSTDRSKTIINQYAEIDDRIRVIHQENKEASAARNAGLDIAQGEYIAFVDSDDWLKKDTLCILYEEAKKYQADIVMGKIDFMDSDGRMRFYNPTPKEMMYIPYSGKELFTRLAQKDSYSPMVWNYLYRRNFLETIKARFEVEATPHEDELWTPIVLCQASRVIAVETNFYFYRYRMDSIMYSTNNRKQIVTDILITNHLFEFAERFDFSSMDREMKSWLYVKISFLFVRAFSLLSEIKDSSFKLPTHQLERLWKDRLEMTPEPQEICFNNYCIAKNKLIMF